MIFKIGRILITVFSRNCLYIKKKVSNPLQSSFAAQVLGGTQENENYLTRLAGQVFTLYTQRNSFRNPPRHALLVCSPFVQ